ncbi:Histidine kinase-, DNA gyrase B-, and HSP90-like ATPase [Clostridium amylolyticum]|uniref:histidine kinase n=1 Tax=Clostridium amylolyticum TaxID=1121298 RepID=A0A1M6ELV9_9CLOT|nr:Spo0B domain-containing protein [Clostridium amylolyticum]SHI86228.1 Histidine kinase-, DNA gyrase B-, and HSP90-like ATPase [Clostridium amylolyticum]
MKISNVSIGKKIIIGSLIVNSIQIILILLLIVNSHSGENLKALSGVLYIIALTMAINSFFTIRSLYSLIFSNGEKQGLVQSINDLKELNRTLRAQRHDFLNHIQIVYGLLELGEQDEALKYMEPVYKDISRVNKALKTSEPAVNALLQAKMHIAEEKHIDVELSITSDLKELYMPSWEYCRIIGNLIDNAIFALGENLGKKKLYIEISEDSLSFRTFIINNGPKIPEAIIDSIFEEGFTTKGDKGQGMGLSIVKELVEHYNGNLMLTSIDDKTSFYIEIPKNTADKIQG